MQQRILYYISPFNFIDQVEIKEMKFLYYTKYVYYSIYNKKRFQWIWYIRTYP